MWLYSELVGRLGIDLVGRRDPGGGCRTTPANGDPRDSAAGWCNLSVECGYPTPRYPLLSPQSHALGSRAGHPIRHGSVGGVGRPDCTCVVEVAIESARGVVGREADGREGITATVVDGVVGVTTP